MTTTWAPRVRVYASSAGLDIAGLRPGTDLVAHARRGDTPRLPEGALLDDLLSPAQRLGLDELAERALEAWRVRRDAQLTVAGVCLPHVHEIELRADVMLPETRAVHGLVAALGAEPPGAVVLEGFDRARAACLEHVLAEHGIRCEIGAPGGDPRYPATFRRAAPEGARRAAVAALRRAAGAPGRVRGGVLIIPHWHLLPLWRRLAADGLKPVLDPSNVPAVDRSELVRAASGGGWIGHPGARARAGSAREVRRALSGASGDPPREPFERLVDRRALELIAAVAPEDLATATVFRQGFRDGLRAAVTLSDAAPVSRLLGIAAREQGRRLVHVQHGLLSLIPGGFGNPPTWSDGMAADQVAVWAQRDVEHLSARAPGRVVHTGNPAADAMVPTAAGQPTSILLLAQPPSVLSCAVDVRATARHLATALAAVADLGTDIPIAYRPHPSDRAETVAVLAASERHGLDVRLDLERPIDAALAEARLCIGSTSTATLQAIAAGVPTVFLRDAGMDPQPPLDGRGALPAASSQAELTGRLEELREAAAPPGRDEALTALGVEPGALDRVAALVEESL